MKNKLYIKMGRMSCYALATAFALWSTACSKNENKGDQEMKIAEVTKEKVNDSVEATREAAKKAKEATQEAWQNFSEFSVDKKEDAVDFLNKQMIALDQKTEDLKEKSEKVTDAGKEFVHDSIKGLEAKRAELALQIEKTKNSTEETWEDVKLETRKKWNAFSESVQEVSSTLSGS